MYLQHHWYFDHTNTMFYHYALPATSVTEADINYADKLKTDKRLLRISNEATRKITLTVDANDKNTKDVLPAPPPEAYFLCACSHFKLTPKQTNTMLHARHCKTYKEIAGKANRSVHTVRNHLYAVFKKVKAGGIARALHKLNEQAEKYAAS
jgi:DNA-binding CsgD family transcriptional regulator